ncbi:MAG: ribonuclease HI family protein [Patescibacteria group bacterium]|nr:ribonuclease HI family protein [Patescibacteria group bacterium]
MSKFAVVHTDGGARGNPGPAGIGVVIDFNGKIIELKKYLGEATNNQAEYQAVILALEKLVELDVKEADFYLDSELVQRQLSGIYKVKNKDLAPLFVKVWNLKQKFGKLKFTHIYREDNKQADQLVNQAIDKALK